jgi:hypothetical protein
VCSYVCSYGCAEYTAGAHVVVLAGDGQNGSWRFMTISMDTTWVYIRRGLVLEGVVGLLGP